MWPDRVSNPGPLVFESEALPTALRGMVSRNGIENLMLKQFKGMPNYFINSQVGETCSFDQQ